MQSLRCCLLIPVLILAVMTEGHAYGQDAETSAALEQLITAYQDQGPWQVDTEIQVTVQSQGHEGRAPVDEIKWIGDAHGRAVATFGGYITRVEPDQITVIHNETEGRFYQRMLSRTGQEAEAAAAVRDMWLSIPDPHVELLLDPSASPEMFARMVASQGDMKLDAVEFERDEQGALVKKTIRFVGPDSSLALMVDPKTGLLSGSTLQITGGPQVAAGSVVTYTQSHQVQPVAVESLDEALQFSLDHRRRTDLLASLSPSAKVNIRGAQVALGEPAPQLVLPMLTGPLISLEELRGEIVIIDFWATWCGPCRKALPHIQEVAEWARQENKPVVVLAVNTMERQRGIERRDAIDQVWDQLELDITVLLDEGNQTAQAWGVSGIPSTFVVDQKGQIIANHRGFSPGIAQQLMKEVEQALAQKD